MLEWTTLQVFHYRYYNIQRVCNYRTPYICARACATCQIV